MTQVNDKNSGYFRSGGLASPIPVKVKIQTDEQAAKALLDYFAEDMNKLPKGRQQMHIQYQARYCLVGEFKELDNLESGNEKGNGSLTASSWNNFMRKVGITGHNIKEKISLEEAIAFLDRMVQKIFKAP